MKVKKIQCMIYVRYDALCLTTYERERIGERPEFNEVIRGMSDSRLNLMVAVGLSSELNECGLYF